jgi:hypothetical protein
MHGFVDTIYSVMSNLHKGTGFVMVNTAGIADTTRSE